MTSNTISGKVVEKETGLGIPSLVVVVFDIDPNTKPEEEIVATPGAPATAIATQQVALGDRLGSVLTGSDGAFQLSYDDADYRVRNPDELRPDLMLLVTATSGVVVPTPPSTTAHQAIRPRRPTWPDTGTADARQAQDAQNR